MVRTIRMTDTDHVILELVYLKIIHEENSPLEDNRVWELLIAIPEERHDELAELCAEFCQKRGLLLEFISHAVQYEVNQTKQLLVLFREDCFAVKAINRLLFGDLGRKYLNRLLTKIIQTVVALPYVLDISNESGLEKSQFEKNIDTMINILEEFLSVFEKSPQFCPVLFREVFASIQNSIDKKFGKGNDSPLVLDFIFFKFFCPAIVNPKKYELIEFDVEISKTSQRSLINVSKFLNDLAHNIVDKFEGEQYSKIRLFIQKNHPLLVSNLSNLVNPDAIQITKEIISASVIQIEISQEEKEIAERRLRLFLDTEICDTPKQSPRSSVSQAESSELFPEKLKAFTDVIANRKWRKFKEAKDTVGYTVKDDENEVVMLKIELLIKVGFDELFKWTSVVENRNRTFQQVDLLYKWEIFSDTGNYREYRNFFKLPFPISNREMLSCEWISQTDENNGFILTEGMTKKLPPVTKGHVRGTVFISGFHLQRDEKDPNVTRVTRLMNGHPGGTIPKWILNSSILSSFKSVVKFKKNVEENFRKV